MMLETLNKKARIQALILAMATMAALLIPQGARAAEDSGQVTGTIVDDATGEAVANLCAFASIGDLIAGASVTNSAGFYAIGQLGPDTYTMTVSDCANPDDPAYETATVDGVVVPAGETVTIDLSVVATGAEHGPPGETPPEAGAEEPAAAVSFDDVEPGSTFHADIVWLAEQGITTGCTSDGTAFCPDTAVTRAQMATFLVRALDLEPVDTNQFDDVSGVHGPNIGALAANGITTGCTSDGTSFCPDTAVTRAQMATFLVRALDLEPVDTKQFDDVSGVHGPNVGALAANGITTGCTSDGTSFCPDTAVTRAQMAAFLHRALGDEASQAAAFVLVPPIVNQSADFLPLGSCSDNAGFVDHFVGLPSFVGGNNYTGNYYDEPMAWNWLKLHLWKWDGAQWQYATSSNWYAGLGSDGGNAANWYELTGSGWVERGGAWGNSWLKAGANPWNSPGWYKTSVETHVMNPWGNGWDFPSHEWVPSYRWYGARYSSAYASCDMT